ncbi:hypothetical protein RYX36_007854 [Vicia faba]
MGPKLFSRKKQNIVGEGSSSQGGGLFHLTGLDFIGLNNKRGKDIDFSSSAINKFLGNPCTLGDDELDEYHIQLAKGNWDFEQLRARLCKSGHTYEVNASGHPLKFSQKSLKTNDQVLMCMILYNLRPLSNTSSIPVETISLLSYMLDEATIDIARVNPTAGAVLVAIALLA